MIVLGIVGLVAEYTIPTLVADTQKQIYVASLKKDYSNWNQALIQMAADSGCIGDLSCFFDSADLKTMGDKIVKYFKVIKNCDTTTKGCYPNIVAYNFDGSSIGSGYDNLDTYRFITADGMSVQIGSADLGCGGFDYPLTRLCMYLYVDVNGLKKPNTMGRDIFLFKIAADKGIALYPNGGIKSSYWKSYNVCDYGYNGGTDKRGIYCAGRIMDDGWQMKY
ncbi:MAG: DUF6613 domain-containing protein [Candidatus Gastranaerophilaceae bacterium]